MARDFEDHCWKDVIPADVLEIYAAYRREVYVGRNPALLAIDLYKLVYRGGAKPVNELIDRYPSACGVFAHAAIEPTRKLFAAARALGLPVIYTTAATKRGSVVATNRQVGTGSGDDYEIYEAFAPRPGDLLIEKERASAFYGTPLVAHLTRLGVDSVLICGDSTSGCVRASTVDAYSNGYHATVVEECVFDRAELIHKIALFDLHHKYADVMTLDEVLEELARRESSETAA